MGLKRCAPPGALADGKNPPPRLPCQNLQILTPRGARAENLNPSPGQIHPPGIITVSGVYIYIYTRNISPPKAGHKNKQKPIENELRIVEQYYC